MEKKRKIAVIIGTIGLFGIGVSFGLNQTQQEALPQSDNLPSMLEAESSPVPKTEDILKKYSISLFKEHATVLSKEEQTEIFGYESDEAFDWESRIATIEESTPDESSLDGSEKDPKVAALERAGKMDKTLYSASTYQPSTDEIDLFYADVMEAYKSNDYMNDISSEKFALEAAFKAKVIALSTEDKAKSEFATAFSELIEIGYKDANALTADLIIHYQAELIRAMS